MAEQSGFFSWWFNELREVFSGRPVPVHALAMSSYEVALIEKGVDIPLGVADTRADDWMEQIEGLRARILRRDKRDPVIEIQLPAEQVMFKKIPSSNGKNHNSTALAYLENLTGQPPGTLSISIAPTKEKDGSLIVAVTPADTVVQAADHARKWGFNPARITSIESPRAFHKGPDFDHDTGKIRGSALPKVTGGIALIAVLLCSAAAARILTLRGDLANEAIRDAKAAVVEQGDLQERQLDLATFAHAGATATDLRDGSLPVWRILAETASVIPGDVILQRFKYSKGQVVLQGTTLSTVTLEEALDSSPVFNAPSLSETRRYGGGRAEFVIEAVIDERGIR